MTPTSVADQETRLRITDLPPFPAVAIRALQLVSRSDTRLNDLHSLICSDPAFATEILRLANSPLYGIRVEIKSTLQATMLLGFERVKGLAFTIGIRAFLGNAVNFPALRTCWRHSLACAMIAEEIVAVGIEKGAAYTAGLIHDIGRLALAAARPPEYSLIAAADCGEPRQRELETFGMDHCQAGAFLIKAWHLPEEFVDIVSRHHEPNAGTIDLLDTIRISCRLADTLGFGFQSPADAGTYGQLVQGLPDSVREIVPAEGKTFAATIASRMSSIETIPNITPGVRLLVNTGSLL